MSQHGRRAQDLELPAECSALYRPPLVHRSRGSRVGLLLWLHPSLLTALQPHPCILKSDSLFVDELSWRLELSHALNHSHL